MDNIAIKEHLKGYNVKEQLWYIDYSLYVAIITKNNRACYQAWNIFTIASGL